MHTGTHYTFKEVMFWTRREIIGLSIYAFFPTFFYSVLDWKWMAIPWLPVALIGTAVAFVVGFKNNASYDRLWEARRIWGSITNSSRTFGLMARDFITNTHTQFKKTDQELDAIHKQILNRHFAWLTALRFQLREKRVWESIYKVHNQKYKNKWFTIDEHETDFSTALAPYLSKNELDFILSKTNKAAQILSLQSAHFKNLLEQGLIDDFRHMELEKMIMEFYNLQGGSERIKNFPYPRQYATLNKAFVFIFILLIPFGMLQEFQKLGQCMIWLTIPFSVLSSWIFTTLEKIGESSESPFEGSANDVPITAISRAIEIDLREMLNEPHDLVAIKPQNNILT